MKTLQEIGPLSGVKVLVRVDFNVPINQGRVVDDHRIRASLPTIEFLRSRGAKVILASHLEANDGSNLSLEPVAEHLKSLGLPVIFVSNLRAAYDLSENELSLSQCMLLQNLRMDPGEKANDQSFAKQLASLADIFVNDAFSVSHRAHASVVSVPKYLPSYAGLQFQSEVSNLAKAFEPSHPFLFILGGAKFETKLPLLTKFMQTADTIFVGGALANDFFRAKGYETGDSLLSKETPDLAAFLGNAKLMLPQDVTLSDQSVKSPAAVSVGERILDAGPETVASLAEKIASAHFILWNGPLGLYEKGFKQPTLSLAKQIGEATGRGVTTILGGGDTLAAVSELGVQDQFTFISMAGGAMLDFLAQGTLPGLEALNQSVD